MKKRIVSALCVILAAGLCATGIYYGTSDKTDANSGNTNTSSSTGTSTSSSDEEYPLGSCAELEDTVVIVTIFANDKSTSWDFTKEEDQTLRKNALTYVTMATNWIKGKASGYGKDVIFIYDYNEFSDLYYETSFEEGITTEDEDATDAQWEYIDSDLPSLDTFKEKYETENVFYMFCFNTEEDSTVTSYTINHYDGAPYPYEFCNMNLHSYGIEENPASYAHEFLHIFGAPDLYVADTADYNYHISQEYVDYCATNHANEIMYNTYDETTGEPLYDKINNDLTDITAYYIGWINSYEEISTWNLLPSEHLNAASY